jgi:ribosome-associated protein
MPPAKITSQDIFQELVFSFSRSSGPGGQHVNKVNTKVHVKFDVVHSGILTSDQKSILLDKLKNKLTKEGVLLLSSQEARSQLSNKIIVIEKLDALFEQAFKRKTIRKPTKPSKASVKRRLENKKHQSEKKANRKSLDS